MANIKNLMGTTAGSKALNGLSKLIAVLIVLVVAAFGDVMYIIKMQDKFPSGGIMLLMCYMGALMSFFAIGYLLLGKTVTFKPGSQLLAAWVVFGMELLILTLNILLVFDNSTDSLLSAWAYIAPATPVLHMIGVAVIFFLDPELHNKHRDQEMADKREELDRQYDYALYNAGMEVKIAQLDHTSKALKAAVNSEESIRIIQEHGARMNAGMLSEMTGQAVGYRQPQIVASNPVQPMQLAQTAQARGPQVEDVQSATGKAPTINMDGHTILLADFLAYREAQIAKGGSNVSGPLAPAAPVQHYSTNDYLNNLNNTPAISHNTVATPTQAPAKKRGRPAKKTQTWDIYAATESVGVSSANASETNA